MVNHLHEKIRKAIDERGTTANKISLKAGLDKSYLRKLFANPDQSPRFASLHKIATALGLPIEHFDADMEIFESGKRPPGRKTAVDLFHGGTDVPVMGTAAANHLDGAFLIEGDVIDYVRRPAGLASARDVYALYIEGTSMAPRYRPGDLVFVNPRRPPRIGDDVVVKERDGDGDNNCIRASIGVLHKRDGAHTVIGKLQTNSDVPIPRERIISVERILTVNELYGA